MIPAMVPELGWSWQNAFLGFTVMGVATGASSWLPTMLIRRWGVRATLVAGAAVMAAGLAANITANPLAAVSTVTVHIAALLVGDQEFDSPKTLAAFALGLVLFALTVLINGGARLLILSTQGGRK